MAPRRSTCASVLAALLLLLTAGSAHGAAGFKQGPEFNTAQANCFPLRAFPAYTQQDGQEPQVEDVFYLSITVEFFQTFDCAADFFAVVVTLPPNVQPAIGGSAVPICRRYGGSAPFFFDQRMASNCPTSVSFDPGTRQFRIGPRPGAVLPDFPDPAGQFFIGQRAPQESQLYTSAQLLIPIKASATMSGQNLGFMVCSVGTSCASGGVPMTVTPAPAAGASPQVSLPGNAFTSATGARVPFTINVSNNNGYYLKVDTSTSPTFTGGRPCGLTQATIYGQTGGTPFTGDFNSEVQYGDLQTGGTVCNLTPATTYYFKACSTNTTTFAELDCATTSFTTGGVTSTFTPPTAIDGSGQAQVTGLQVLGGHPAGNLYVGRRLKSAGGGFSPVTANVPVAAATTSSSPTNHTVTGFEAWRAYELASCYQVTGGSLFCSPPVAFSAGSIASSDATEVSQSGAVLHGQPSAPSPAGAVRFLLGTTNPAPQDPRGALSEAASVEVAARSAADSIAGTVTGLAPGTQYFWSACFDNPADPGIEGCSSVRSFTTAAASDAPAPSGETPGTGTPPPPAGGAAADTTKPRASLKVVGRLRRGRVITLRIGASDASGIRSITLKVGKARARRLARRTVKIKLPRRAGKLVLVVVVTDRAGNRTTIRRALRVK